MSCLAHFCFFIVKKIEVFIATRALVFITVDTEQNLTPQKQQHNLNAQKYAHFYSNPHNGLIIFEMIKLFVAAKKKSIKLKHHSEFNHVNTNMQFKT